MDATRNPEVLRLKLASKRLSPSAANVLRRFLHSVLGFNRFNEIYASLPPCEPLEIAQTMLDSLGIRLKLSGEPLTGIPAEGPLVVLANHHYGLIDGLLVDALVTSRRPDGALMVVSALAVLPEYEGRLILVGQRGKQSRQKVSIRGWREAIKWLAAGRAIGVFPAGGLARFKWRELSVRDQQWSPHVAALIRRSGATVVPIYIHGSNRLWYQLIGVASPPLQEVLIFGELAEMRNRTVRVTLGRTIPPDELSRFASDEEAIAFLRSETEKLSETGRAAA